MVRFSKFVAFMCFASISKANPWVDEIAKTGQRTLVQCRRSTGVFEKVEEDFGDSVIQLKNCLRSAFLDSLDELVASSEIPISDYVSLVASNSSAYESNNGRADPNDDLLTTVTNKMYAILDTHSIQLNLSPFDGTEAEGQVEVNSIRSHDVLRSSQLHGGQYSGKCYSNVSGFSLGISQVGSWKSCHNLPSLTSVTDIGNPSKMYP